jgi:hypothetical protein
MDPDRAVKIGCLLILLALVLCVLELFLAIIGSSYAELFAYILIFVIPLLILGGLISSILGRKTTKKWMFVVGLIVPAAVLVYVVFKILFYFFFLIAKLFL